MPTLFGRAICCCTAEKLRFRLRMPDLLMECSKIRFQNRHAESRTSWPGCSTQCAAWALPLVHSPRQAPKPLDAWFFEAAGDRMHLPSPGWLVASQQSNRWCYRGGLSFGAQGGPGLRLGAAGRLCAGGSRGRGCVAGHASGHNSVGLQGHRRHGRTCMPMPRGDDKTSQWSCQNTDRMSSMFGSGVQ